jgi:uncharacterized protein involved in response to NO
VRILTVISKVGYFAVIALAAMIRVFGGMLLPGIYLTTVVVSGLCWSAAFGIYAVRYWPILSRVRLTAKPDRHRMIVSD